MTAAAMLLGAGCVAGDYAARALRLRVLVRGGGGTLGWWDAVAVNAMTDAAATVTPWRLGGEPVRIGSLRAAGVPYPTIAAAIAGELLLAWPLLVVATGLVVAGLVPGWWRDLAPRLEAEAAAHGSLLVAGALTALVALALARHAWRRLPAAWRTPLRDGADAWRRLPPRTLLAAAALTLVTMIARVALLPALAMALPAPPPAAALWAGSFLLVYGQLLVPVPAGAGLVDAGLLAGAAGDFAQQGGALLIAWRCWSVVVPCLLGTAAALRTVTRHRRTATVVATP